MTLQYILKKIKGNKGLVEYLLNIGIIGTALSVAYGLGLVATIQANEPKISFEQNDLVVSIKGNTESIGSFLASKNGTKYYPTGCKSSNRIKEGNKVYFSSEDEAKKAGFELSKTC
ncbi:MAG: hypothetical protein ACI9GH_000004 [Candidatus Paceibacteria bacterium]|jgi:hypothetical protein